MTTYYRGFGDADGISDFTEIPTSSGQTAPAWSVVNTDQVQATSASSHSEALVWGDIDDDGGRADFEILGQVYIDSSSTTQRWYTGRMSTSGSSRTGYAMRLRTTNISIYSFNAATFTSIADTSVSISSGTWVWVRFRVNGTAVKVKQWTGAVGSEPGTWDIDTTDSTYSTAGHVGLLKGSNTNTQLWRYFGVGTSGDTAPSAGASAAASMQPRRAFPRPILLF